MSPQPFGTYYQAKPSNVVVVGMFQKTVLHSFLFGFLWIPITIGVLFALTFIEWWRFDYWSTRWMWDLGGFPCIGLFSITSASYFLHKMIACRFVTALTICAVGTIACYIIGNIIGIWPRMYKTTEIHWQRPEFLAWLLIPPWLVAALFYAYRNRMGTTSPPKKATPT